MVEKERFREFERAAGDYQMRQILAGRAEGAETSGMFLDIVRDLKRIESHIAATAYPLVERSGELRRSRLS